MRHLFRIGWLLLWLSMPAARCEAGVELISALPSLGRATDIRDSSAVQTTAGQWTVFQSLSYRFADEKFDANGRATPLGFNQTISILSAPLSAGYGINERLVLGVTVPVVSRIRRSISLTNYAAGATLFGQALPAGQSIRIVQKGDGEGDLTANSQFRLSRAGADLGSFLSLDVTVPTAQSDPKSALELPIGQGYWSLTPSLSLNHKDGSWTHFAKAGYELTTEAVARDSAGNRAVFKAAQGGTFAAGTSFRAHRSVSARLNLFAFERLGREEQGLQVAGGNFRSVELRPGLTAQLGKVRWDADTFLPVAGGNVLRTTGLFVTAGVTF